MWLSHLGTKTSIQAETQYPGSFAVVDFNITGFAFGGVWTCHGGFTVEVEICGHPEKELSWVDRRGWMERPYGHA